MRILHSNKIEAKIYPLIGVLIINDDIKTEKRTRLQQFGRSLLGHLGIGALLFIRPKRPSFSVACNPVKREREWKNKRNILRVSPSGVLHGSPFALISNYSAGVVLISVAT